MLGFGSLGQFSLGEYSVVVTVNFNAIGVGVAGAITPKVDRSLTGVAGTGIAGTLTPNPKGTIAGAAGIGVAGTLNSFNVMISISGVIGTGQAGIVTPQISASTSGATGTGVAGSIITPAVVVTVQGAAGIGVANAERDQVSVVVPGVSGVGTAGILGRFDITLTLSSAVGVGIAGVSAGNLSLVVPPASGVGVTNWAPRAFHQFTFVELVHFDAYPVDFRSDMTTVSVVVAGAIGGGVAGEIQLVLSGGGTSGDGDRRKRKTGFEPIKKHPAPPEKPEPTKVWTPPKEFIRSPSIVPQRPGPDLVERELLPLDVLGIQQQIFAAEDISDVNRFLAGLEQDEQDAADIADVLAILD